MNRLENITIGWRIAPTESAILELWRVVRFRGECWVLLHDEVESDIGWFWLPDLIRNGWVRVGL